jgi:hypothetical protein
LNALKHIPVSTDPCGKVQRHPEQQHRAPGAHQGRLHDQLELGTVCALLLRRLRQPATHDGSNALTLSRTGQNNQAHSIVFVHNQVLSSSTLNRARDDQQDAQRPAAAEFSATRPRRQGLSPVPGYHASTSPATASSIGNGGTNPGYFNSKASRLPTTSTWCAATTSSRSVELDHSGSRR